MARIFDSEMLRFRGFALAFGLVHFIVLVVVAVGQELFAPEGAKVAVGIIVYSAMGLILGLYQLGTQRKLNRWTFLIHRPVAPANIFLAMSGAGVTLLCAAVGLPLLLMAFLTDSFTSQSVDFRHFLLPLFVVGIALFHYFAAIYIMLSANRGAVLVLVLSSFFLTREAVGLWIFLPLLMSLIWVAYLALSAFKPDLSTPPRSGWAIGAASLAIQYALFLILFFAVNFGFSLTVALKEVGWRSFAVFSWNDYFPEGTFEHTTYRDDLETLMHGLNSKDTPQTRHLQGQLELAETTEIYRRFAKYPAPNQLMSGDRMIRLTDEENDTLWTYSHDHSLFFGREARTREGVGWLGSQGVVDTSLEQVEPELRFSEIPYVVGQQLVTRQRIFSFDSRSQRVHLRFLVPAGEAIVSAMDDHGFQITVLSDQALYFFNRRDLEWTQGEVAPTARIPLPQGINNLSRIHLAELIDSTVVSFVFGSQSSRDFGQASQVVGELNPDGSFQVVSERPLAQGMPELFRFRGIILSPVLQVLEDLVWSWIGPSREQRVDLEDHLARGLPTSVFWAVVLSALLAAVATFLATRSREVSPGSRLIWILTGLCCGWPAVLSLFFLTARRAPKDIKTLHHTSIGLLENPA